MEHLELPKWSQLPLEYAVVRTTLNPAYSRVILKTINELPTYEQFASYCDIRASDVQTEALAMDFALFCYRCFSASGRRVEMASDIFQRLPLGVPGRESTEQTVGTVLEADFSELESVYSNFRVALLEAFTAQIVPQIFADLHSKSVSQQTSDDLMAEFTEIAFNYRSVLEYCRNSENLSERERRILGALMERNRYYAPALEFIKMAPGHRLPLWDVQDEPGRRVVAFFKKKGVKKRTEYAIISSALAEPKVVAALLEVISQVKLSKSERKRLGEQLVK